MVDSFISKYTAGDLEIAGEFLTNWLPFLTPDLCDSCCQTLTGRIKSLQPDSMKGPSSSIEHKEHDSFNEDLKFSTIESPCPDQHVEPPGRDTDRSSPTPVEPSSYSQIEPSGWGTDQDIDPSPISPKVKMSWADMAQQEDELASDEETAGFNEEDKDGSNKKKKVELSREQRERIRFQNVGRRKDFICLEKIKGKIVNILDGLELHTGVFSAAEQKRIVDFIYELQEKGRRSELGERTYSEPQKWMRGKGRVTIQFGCCYNYATDKEGNPPGILHAVAPDPIPSLFKVIIKRLVRWHVLPTSCIPDSCIVNIYEPGDCIPPHIDSHDFVRPFCTVSFLSECNIVFGSRLMVEGAGEFSGSTAIPLPVGSVLVINGNGADVAKHCVPAVPAKRISITFRKMDETKHPKDFIPEPDLRNIQPLTVEPQSTNHPHVNNGNSSSNMQTQRRENTYQRERRENTYQRERRENTYQRGRRPSETRSQPYNHESTPLMRPRQTIIPQSAPVNNSTTWRLRDSTRRQKDSNPRSLYHDIRKQADDNDEDEEGTSSSHSESNGSGRRVRLEQKRIVITRNIDDGDDDDGNYSKHGSGQVRDLRGSYRPKNLGRR